MRIILKNGYIVDGSGEPGYPGYVVLEQDRIAEVGKEAPESFNGFSLDCQGAIIAPGFIDGHSHNDWFTDRNDPLPYFESFAEQGIAGSVAGNCGFSAAGYPRDFLQRPSSGYKEDGLDFSRMDDWFNYVDRFSPENMACLQGHGTLRAGIAGFDPAPLSSDNMKTMLCIAEESLEAGSCGISLGLMYAPGIFAPKEELMELAKLCKKYNRVLTVHPRAEGIISMEYPIDKEGRAHVLLGLDEVIELGRQTGAKVHYSHAIFVGRKSCELNDELLDEMEKAKDEGVDISFDMYSIDCGSTFLTVIMPDWYHALSPDDKKKPENLKNLKDGLQEMEDINGFGIPNFCFGGGAPDMEAYIGKWIPEIADEWGVDNFDAYMRLVELTNGQGRATIDGVYTDEVISRQTRHPLSQFMNDTWYEAGSIQNEHLYSGFPRFLELSRDGKGPCIEETIHKMSYKIAERFGLRDRGLLRKGAFADVCVFELSKIKTHPSRKAEGIAQVFINGKQVIRDGELDRETFLCAGKAMRAYA